MIAEPSLAAFAKVVFHTVTAHGDPLYRITSPDLFHQFITIDVRQANITDDYIESLFACQLECGSCAPCRPYDITRSSQKLAQNKCRIRIVVYEQDAQRFPAATRAVRRPSMFIYVFRYKIELSEPGTLI